MYSLKKSLAALVGISLLVLASAALLPRVGQGQAGDRNPLQRDTRRAFYLTRTEHLGSQALAACAAGYHMASLWEIHDPSNLRYNGQLGHTTGDAGSGPPTSYFGWVRTGFDASLGGQSPGAANCGGWTSASGTVLGTVVGLQWLWDADGKAISPWGALPTACDAESRVWCAQD